MPRPTSCSRASPSWRRSWLSWPPERSVAGSAAFLRTGASPEPERSGLLKDAPPLLLLQLGAKIVPEPADLLGRVAFGLEFADRAAIGHRRGEIGPVLDQHRGDRAALGQRDHRIRGDLGT